MPRDPQDPPDARGNGPASGPVRTVGGRYRLEGVLGRGGMGVVWAGRDTLLDRPVAIKEVIPPSGIDDADRAEVRARTLREARTAARISADGVVAIYDVVEDDGRPWIVMEQLPPHTLEDELSERDGLPPAEVAQIGSTLLAGLMAAHAAGVLHRDVKPSNVMFRDRPDGRRAVLADFGIAHLDGDAILTATGVMMGSPAYIAPERARGEPATPASDLWSLGVTLWAAVEGWSPFRRANSLASLTAVITEDVPRPTRAGPLQPVLEGLLRKDPAERIDAATARRLLADALGPAAPLTERLGVTATRPLPVRTSAVAGAAAGVRPGGTVGGTAGGTTSAPPRARTGVAPPQGAPPDRPGPVDPATDPTPAPSPTPPSWTPAALRREEHPGPRRGRRLLPAVVAVALVGLVAIAMAVLEPFDGDAGDPLGAAPEVSAPATVPAPGPEASAPAGDPAEDAGATSPEVDAGAADGASDDDPAAAAPGSGAEGLAPEGTQAGSGADGSGAAGSEAAGSGQSTGGAAGSADGAVPAGFERYTDPSGFSVAIPAGWRAEREGPRVYLRDPASRAYLLVDQTDDPAADPVADWRQQEPAVAGRLENYDRIGEIEPVDYRGWRAADWEFVFGPNQNTHVLNRNVITAADRAYALYWSVPSSRWDAMLPVHEQVAASFQPAG